MRSSRDYFIDLRTEAVYPGSATTKEYHARLSLGPETKCNEIADFLHEYKTIFNAINRAVQKGYSWNFILSAGTWNETENRFEKYDCWTSGRDGDFCSYDDGHKTIYLQPDERYTDPHHDMLLTADFFGSCQA